MSDLNETGKLEVVRLIEIFKKKMSDCSETVLSEFYTNIPKYIGTDSWTNYREQLRHELGGGFYNTPAETLEGEWAKGIRRMIVHEHKEVLIPPLNQDLKDENERLKQELKQAYERWR